MTRLYKLDGSALVPVPRSRLSKEDMIEDWLANQPDLLGLNLLIMGRQVVTDYGGEIDLLALDEDGDVVILELKRDRTPREIIAQVFDYASWVAKLTPREIHERAVGYLQRPLQLAFREHFETELPESLNASHSIVIVASAFDASSLRIVRYLSEQHDIAINTAFFTVFENKGETLLATDWLLEQSEVVDRSVAKTRPPWSGLWYVNVGEGESRSWEDMRRYGFIAGGRGEKFARQLQRLKAGDRIVAYQSGAGYVGYGIVTTPAVMARDFETPNGKLLDQDDLVQKGLAHDRDDPALAEYAVGVNWIKAVDSTEAKRFPGIFAVPLVVAKLRDPKTIEFLQEHLAVETQ